MTVIRGAAVVDGTGAEPRRAAVSVEHGRILAVDDTERASPGAEVIDAQGCTLLPGLIDLHAHLGFVSFDPHDPKPIAVTAAEVFRNCELALDAGFTTLRDAGGIDGGVVQAVEGGLVRGPRILPSGPIICQTGGHGDLRRPFDHDDVRHGQPGLMVFAAPCDGPDQVRHAARQALRRGARQVKICINGGVVSLSDDPNDPQLTPDEISAAVYEAKARGTYVMAHSFSPQAMQQALDLGVSCFEHAVYLDEETAQRMARVGAVVDSTLTVAALMAQDGKAWGLPEVVLPRIQGVLDSLRASLKIAHDAGVLVGSGSDLLGTNQNRRGYELVLKAEVLGPMAAIVAATLSSARVIRMDKEIGSIEAGKRADLILVNGDPLREPQLFDDPQRVVLVMKDGRIAKDRRSRMLLEGGASRSTGQAGAAET